MERTSERRAVGLVVAAVVGAIAAGAIALAANGDTRSSLDDAAKLRSADLALSAYDTAAVSVSRAVALAESEAAGVADPDDVAVAVESAVSDIARVGSHLDDVSGELGAQHDVWAAAATDVLGEIDAGNPLSAAASLADVSAPAGDVFAAELIEERNDIADRVADGEDSVRWFGRVAGFLVVFLLPAAAILVYAVSARRQISSAASCSTATLLANASPNFIFPLDQTGAPAAGGPGGRS